MKNSFLIRKTLLHIPFHRNVNTFICISNVTKFHIRPQRPRRPSIPLPHQNRFYLHAKCVSSACLYTFGSALCSICTCVQTIPDKTNETKSPKLSGYVSLAKDSPNPRSPIQCCAQILASTILYQH